MKRKLTIGGTVSVVLVVLAALFLTTCGGGDGGVVTPAPQTTVSGTVSAPGGQVAFFKSEIGNQRLHRIDDRQPKVAPSRRILRAGGVSISLFLGLVGSMTALLAHGLVDNTLFFPDLALAFFLILWLVQRESFRR